MQDGFVRVAAGTPRIKVADTKANTQEIVALMNQACDAQAKLLVLPELCLTGCTCRDLFFQPSLIEGALAGLKEIMMASDGTDMITVVGLPMVYEGSLYNCAAIVQGGWLLGVVPKTRLHSVEHRWFSPGRPKKELGYWFGKDTPFGASLVFASSDYPEFSMGVSIHCSTPAPSSPSVIVCPAAYPQIIGASERFEQGIKYLSTQQTNCYIVACAGVGESTTDSVYAGRNLIYENGKQLAQSKPYATGLIMTELDLSFIQAKRRTDCGDYVFQEEPVWTDMDIRPLELTRRFERLPFVPEDEKVRAERCEEILSIQVQALAQRMHHMNCKTAIVGVSGGLDSTLAMIVSARAVQELGLSQDSLLAITMPCFGTTARTKGNAQKLTECLGGQFREINISAAVTQHLQDIGHDINVHDAAYENAQARERTQVLMDIGNMVNGLVVGTGDLSELALGWTTYNGDHMSMYGVNGGVPKTLMRHIVDYCADQAGEGALQQVLRDILNTPVSPELLPPVDGDISQRTEDLVGPYELHDYFLYHMLRRMEEPQKMKRLAMVSFEGVYDEETIHKWLNTFLQRFFSQQFKRSCMPDGPGVGSVSLSPRGGLFMPSDANSQLWLKNLQ